MGADEETILEVPGELKREDLLAACGGLNEHNRAHIGIQPDEEFAVYLRDAAGQIIGGICGSNDAGWLNIGALFVHEPFRRKGHGSRLLEKLEHEAVSKGCRHATLQTYPYQALDFYLHNGYRVFGQLEDYPGEHARYFLRKELRGPR